jgi:hypothetical protein
MQGSQGPSSCPGAGTGLRAELAVSAPAQGSFFTPGEAPLITIRFLDRCGQTIPVASLGTANLYVTGPREPLLNKTAAKLLNCVMDRAAADRQHHYVNLIAPKYADPSQANLKQADGVLRYQLAKITDEPPGTYTVGVYTKSKDQVEQIFPLADFQIGTAKVEPYISGDAKDSTCAACHVGPASPKFYMHHIDPGNSPLGNYALDTAPIATCKHCHNQDGYSRNTTLRKVHGVHRGHHQINPGVAHPEYGVGADTSLRDYLNTGFPTMPEGEKDCASCHADERWRTTPSRQACGACHETLFFDTGTLTPPRRLTTACTTDNDCKAVGQLPVCNTDAKVCEVRSHPKQADDSQCATCHSADTSGVSPIAARHEVLSKTRARGLKLTDFALSGGSGMQGTVMEGDVITLRFKLSDSMGAPITDLKTNTALAATVIISGPTTDRQMVFPSINMKTAGTLVYENGGYTWTAALPFPARAIAPLNTTGMGRINPPGTYTAYAYVVETRIINGVQVRESLTGQADFRFKDPALPVRPRQVVTQAACNSCHVQIQGHGGSRQSAPNCSTCHTTGAVDRTVGAVGLACTTDAQCQKWEACRDTNGDGRADACVITQDPTPNQSVEFSTMIHSIHFARLLDGYASRGNLVKPGALAYVGFRNSYIDLSEALFPLDVRDCAKCHADTGAACSAAPGTAAEAS